jgi:hypothetical protein
VLGASSIARAQGPSLVPTGDLAYSALDRLDQLGLLDSLIVGQRPYSRREFARLARAAEARLSALSSAGDEQSHLARDIVARLVARFAPAGADSTARDLTAGLADAGSVSISSTSAERRALVGQGQATEATIDPLAERRLGRPALRGQSGDLELEQRFEPTSWLAFAAGERVELRHPTDANLSSTDGELLRGSVRALYSNLALTMGREQLAWAQHAGDGLFIASDAPALDQVSLASDAPFSLPGFLRALGPTQGTLVVANLGRSNVRAYSTLLAYKVSVRPASTVEIGGTFMNHFGGVGSPGASKVDRLVDFLPFIDVFRRHNYKDTTRTLDVESDKLLGVDGRVHFPSLGGLIVAGELLADDIDVHRLHSMLTWDGSQTVRFILPTLATSALSLELNAKHMGVRTYTHGQLSDGITTLGRLIGDELGPDAKQFGASLSWMPDASRTFALAGSSSIYSKVDYAPTDVTGVLQLPKARTYPNELRDILLASAIVRRGELVSLCARAGAERSRNYAFAGGRRVDYVAALALQFAH